MKKALALQEHTLFLGEEIANSVSHGVGLLAAAAAAPVLVFSAAHSGGAARIGRERLCGHDGAAVPHIHALPRVAKESGQATHVGAGFLDYRLSGDMKSAQKQLAVNTAQNLFGSIQMVMLAEIKIARVLPLGNNNIDVNVKVAEEDIDRES